MKNYMKKKEKDKGRKEKLKKKERDEKVAKSDVWDSLPVYSFWSKIRPNSSKLRFVHIFGTQKDIRKSMPKKYEKICQKVPKMKPKWMPKPLIVHTFSKKAKTVETICFTI